MKPLGPKETAIMAFLHDRVFDPILTSAKASSALKQGVRLTIVRMNERDAAGMVHYFWAAIKGTDRAIGSLYCSPKVVDHAGGVPFIHPHNGKADTLFER